jgi:hypothetical protein
MQDPFRCIASDWKLTECCISEGSSSKWCRCHQFPPLVLLLLRLLIEELLEVLPTLSDDRSSDSSGERIVPVNAADDCELYKLRLRNSDALLTEQVDSD